jgi:rhodanese-related sulfurtransferase
MPKSIDDLLDEVRARYERIDAVTAARECEGGALLVDTRPAEYRRKHGEVPGAITIGLDILEWRLDPQCPSRIAEAAHHDLRIILVCRQGYSSSLAVGRLLDLGLRRATDVIDGVEGWAAAGLPLIGGGEGSVEPTG